MSLGGVDGLYTKRPATLWVEDPLTRNYLLELWKGAPRISILVAGGTQGVRAMVSKARAEKYGAVFGLSDRDFGSTNRGNWNSKTEVFRLEMYEAENALLHSDAAMAGALAELAHTKSVDDIRIKILEIANGFAWGMALGATLNWIKEEALLDYPSSGGLINIGNERSAADRIFQGQWWRSVSLRTSKKFKKTAVRTRLQSEHHRYVHDLKSASYRRSFAGKEIFQHMYSWMIPGPQLSSAMKVSRDDVVKAIAHNQRMLNAMPPEFVEIEKHILGAIPPN